MSHIIFIASTFFLLMQCSSQRKTILRTNWGVHFEEIDSLVSSSGMSHYQHSFAVPWPKLKHNTSKLLNCDKNMGWYTLCKSINRIIIHMNQNNFEIFSYASNTIDETISLIPHARNHNNDTNRVKRNVFVDAFTDLFHMPGHRDLTTLKAHLKEVTEAMKLNSDAIKEFNNALSSTQCLLNNRISNLLNGLGHIEQNITQISSNMNQTFTTINNSTEKLMNRTNHIAALISYIATKFLPRCFMKHSMMKDLLQEAENWHEGITTLATGYLSNFLIPVDLISEIIQHISRNVLIQPKYAHMKLISSNPLYYYKQKNIAATRQNDMLIILVKFPLHHVGGLLRVYRTDVFPIPASSGLSKMKGINYDETYTVVNDIATYFAITFDGEYYLTLSESLYQSCKGEGIKLCKDGISSLQHSTSVSCISALFFDDKKGIHSTCAFISTRSPPVGTAIQLTGDDSFLVHGAFAGNDTWRLRCIDHKDNTQQSLRPCSMCRVKLPCFCTLGADQFEIAARMTECSKNLVQGKLPKVTYLYHPNLIMITSLYPHSELAKLQGYEAKINSFYPPLVVKVPHIIASNWSQIAEREDKLKNDYKKMVKATHDKVVSFETKEDLIAQKVQNFSDVTVDRSTDLSKAISDALAPFPTLRHILGLLFSNLGVSLLIFFIMSLKMLKVSSFRTKLCFKFHNKLPNKYSQQYNASYHKLHELNLK